MSTTLELRTKAHEAQAEPAPQSEAAPGTSGVSRTANGKTTWSGNANDDPAATLVSRDRSKCTFDPCMTPTRKHTKPFKQSLQPQADHDSNTFPTLRVNASKDG
jgi:hypothetical protein